MPAQPRSGVEHTTAATAMATAQLTTSAAPSSDRPAASQPEQPTATTIPETSPDTFATRSSRGRRRASSLTKASSRPIATTTGRLRSTGSPSVTSTTSAAPSPTSATRKPEAPRACRCMSPGQPIAVSRTSTTTAPARGTVPKYAATATIAARQAVRTERVVAVMRGRGSDAGRRHGPSRGHWVWARLRVSQICARIRPSARCVGAAVHRVAPRRRYRGDTRRTTTEWR